MCLENFVKLFEENGNSSSLGRERLEALCVSPRQPQRSLVTVGLVITAGLGIIHGMGIATSPICEEGSLRACCLRELLR